MNGKSKKLCLILILTLSTASLLAVKPTLAEPTPKPSVPAFTLKYVDNSYDVSPIYSADQYTGNTVMTQAGYHVENKSVELTITNKPFSSFKDASGNTLNLYYDIRWKGYYGDYWADYNS